MNIMVTGAAGFLGRRLIERLLTLDYLTDSQGNQRSINKIMACDVVPLSAITDQRVQVFCGDIADSPWLASIFDQQVDTVFHLAAVVSTWRRSFPVRRKKNLIWECASILMPPAAYWNGRAS